MFHEVYTRYSADELGNVYGVKGNKLNPILHHTGYIVMTLYNNGLMKQARVHRFVWECFNGLIPESLVINHKNGDKTDNRLCNLELTTNQQNVQHCWDELGRVSCKKGEGHHNAKLTELQVIEIKRLLSEGRSNKDLADLFNIDAKHVSLIKLGKRWKHL